MHPRAERGILLGLTHGGATYKVFLPKLNKSVISSAVVFDELPTETSFMNDICYDWTTPDTTTDEVTDIETGSERDVESDEDEIGLEVNSHTRKNEPNEEEPTNRNKTEEKNSDHTSEVDENENKGLKEGESKDFLKYWIDEMVSMPKTKQKQGNFSHTGTTESTHRTQMTKLNPRTK